MNTLEVPRISRDNERIFLYENHGVWFGRATIKTKSGWWMSVGEVIVKEDAGGEEKAIENLEALIENVRSAPILTIWKPSLKT